MALLRRDTTIGNYDHKNKGYELNPVVGYNFDLEVEAAFFMPLRSVKVFSKENEFEYYQEGGLNDYVHMLRKPISKPFTFQVERYVGVSGSKVSTIGGIDPIALGTELVLPVILYVSRALSSGINKDFSLSNVARAYVFTGCVVTAKEYGELDAEKSSLHTETTTIAYKELFVINNPVSDRERLGWDMGDAPGSTTNSRTVKTAAKNDKSDDDKRLFILNDDSGNPKSERSAATQPGDSDRAEQFLWAIGSKPGSHKNSDHIRTAKDSGKPEQFIWDIGESPGSHTNSGHIKTAKDSGKPEQFIWDIGEKPGSHKNSGHIRTAEDSGTSEKVLWDIRPKPGNTKNLRAKKAEALST